MKGPFDEILPEMQGLLDSLCEESIEPEQLRRLEELILSYPEAEAYYVQYMAFYSNLIGHFGVLPGGQDVGQREPAARPPAEAKSEAEQPALQVAPRKRARILRWGPGLGMLAAAILIVVGWWPRQPPVPDVPKPAPEATDNTVAVLIQAPGAVWEDASAPHRPGTPLSPGWLRLKSGSAHLEFYNGAMVILEGPAEFKLVSRTEAYCARGKLRATVPSHAVGFVIGSPKTDLVDRGTEFGLQVGADDNTEVHVFQGKVELHNSASARKDPAATELTTGQSVRLEGPGKVQPIKQDSASFPTAQDLADRLKKETQLRRQGWLAASEAIRKDPALLAYYTFENKDSWNRTLLDQAGKRDQPRDGAVVGCSWGTGRWPGKKGLEFKRVSDRVRINIPGEFESITMMAWVRVDGLPNRNNSLLMSDGWDEGELHWQIGASGTVILGVQSPVGVQSGPKGKGGHYHAAEALTPDRFGQWLHLAVVYDRANGHVTHFVDGRMAAQEVILFDVPLRIGEAELGNWNPALHQDNHPIRNLNGCMDEFMVFARALGEQEIERHHAQGQPPQ